MAQITTGIAVNVGSNTSCIPTGTVPLSITIPISKVSPARDALFAQTAISRSQIPADTSNIYHQNHQMHHAVCSIRGQIKS